MLLGWGASPCVGLGPSRTRESQLWRPLPGLAEEPQRGFNDLAAER
jgi:hypothetical protein